MIQQDNKARNKEACAKRPPKCREGLTGSEKGTALISVLLIFAICSMLAIEMQSRQHIDIRRTTNILSRDQAYLYVAAAEEIAFGVLKEDLNDDKKNGVEKDHLKEDWHGEKSFPVEGGAITASLQDLQRRFNINALKSSDPHQLEGSKRIFGELMTDLGLPKSEDGAMPTADMLSSLLEWMDEDDENTALIEAEDYYYQGLELPYRTSNNYITNISELRVIRGFTDNDIAELEEYLSFLPPDVPINVNTVDETLAALIMPDGASLIVSDRPEKGWNNVADIQQPPANTGNTGANTGSQSGSNTGNNAPPTVLTEVYSEYFLLTATATINERTFTNKSVIYRPRAPDKNNPIRVIMRDRGRQFHYPKKQEQQI